MLNTNWTLSFLIMFDFLILQSFNPFATLSNVADVLLIKSKNISTIGRYMPIKITDAIKFHNSNTLIHYYSVTWIESNFIRSIINAMESPSPTIPTFNFLTPGTTVSKIDRFAPNAVKAYLKKISKTPEKAPITHLMKLSN